MKLTAFQWLVIIAILAMFGGMVLDVMGVIAPPEWLWVAFSIILLVASRLALPSLAELGKANHRHG